jgi:hypothetical protein
MAAFTAWSVAPTQPNTGWTISQLAAIQQTMQATSVIFDEDTATLELRLSDGGVFRILEPAVAKQVYDKISVGGQITDVQRTWLEKYRVDLRSENRQRLRDLLKEMREEIRGEHFLGDPHL